MVNSVRELLRSGWRIYSTRGLRRTIREGVFYGYEAALRTGCSLLGKNHGDSIFDEDWDILLILDACRADLFTEVQDEYSFIDSVETRRSVGSTSAEWMENTFTDEHQDALADTVYVTGNPFSDSDVDKEQLGEVDEVWRSEWDESAGTIQPRPLTDAAIRHWRSEKHDRMIVHYMQPHYPFLTSTLSEDRLSLDNWGDDVTEKNVWTRLRDGEVEYEPLWEAYRDNLRFVLDDVELLLESVGADKVVLTADHGNGLGEYGIYGHPYGICTAALREVPWASAQAESVRDYQPSTNAEAETENGGDVSDRLEALGYK